jgi:HK97 family phage portal protein
MGLRSRLANWVVRNADLDLKSTRGWLAMLGGVSSSGVKVTPENSVSFSAVNAAVRIRGETRASLPVMIFKRTSEGKEENPEHPLFTTLAYSPNPYINYFDFWYTNNLWLDLYGNSYHLIYKKRGDDYASALIPVHPTNCEPKIVEGKLEYHITGTTNNDGRWKYSQVVHFRGMSTDGIKGRSPIEMGQDSVGLGKAAETFGGKYFKKNGVLRAVIQSKSQINDEAYDTLKKRWNENDDHDTPILDRGMEYNDIGGNPNDAQALETRQFQVREIARFLNVPVAFLQDYEQMAFRNIEHQDLMLAKYSIRPILKRDESELERKLLPDDEWKTTSIKWNLDAMLRADIKSRADYYSKMIQHRVLNPNEARRLEDLNPYEGGDEYANPNTLSKVGSNGQEKQKTGGVL